MGCWTVDGEGLAIALVVVSLDQWELDFGIVELLDLVTSGLDSGDLFDFDDLRRENVELAMITCRFTVAAFTWIEWARAR